MASVVWFFDELFLQHTIDLGRLKVIPIEVVDPLGPAAYGELARSEGWHADVSLFKVGVRNLAAFVLDDVDASSPNEGLLLSGPVVGDVAAAVAYHQKGEGTGDWHRRRPRPGPSLRIGLPVTRENGDEPLVHLGGGRGRLTSPSVPGPSPGPCVRGAIRRGVP